MSPRTLPPLALDTHTLDNGLEVILHRDPAAPLVAVNIWYHVGSKNERPGRSGFAHLFEHMMFQGSEHQDTEYFGPLQEIGAQLNGSTSTDRTNYWQSASSNHLERLLLMEADRMGWLIPAMTQEKLDNQRDVVRNERRQSEGAPYSVYRLEFNRLMYPPGHPYDHSVIGEHEDLEAAGLEDVQDFFRTFYLPNNASLCLAGDFDPDQAMKWIRAYFGEIPPGDPVENIRAWVPELPREKRVLLRDRVELTRLHYAWHTTPVYHRHDAELDLAARILGQGRTSRLYRNLIHEKQWAQDVGAWQAGAQLASTFQVHVTLRPGVDPGRVEAEVDAEIQKLKEEGPTAEELERAVNSYEAAFIKALQRIGSFGGKSDLLNAYNHYRGTPDYLQEDFNRYVTVSADSMREAMAAWLGEGRLVAEVAPAGRLRAGEASGVDRGTLPPGGAEPELNIPPSELGTLPNGLKVITLAKPGLPLVRAELAFGSGVRDDSPESQGLAALSADMLLSGTEGLDKFAFAEALDSLGTDMGSSASTDYSALSMMTLTKHLDASFDLMAQALLQPAYRAEELEHERARRTVNVRREAENPWKLVSRATRRMVYGAGHPYAGSAAGTVESLAAMAPPHLKAFAQKHYTPGNAFLLVVGEVDHDTVMTLAQEHLGSWRGEAPPRPAFPPGEQGAERTVFLLDKPGDSQSTLALTHLGLPRSAPEWEAVYLMNRVLGGMFTSRLNLNLREEKGYTYGAWSRFSEAVHGGLFSMGGRVQTEVTGPALTECIKELEDIRQARPVTAEELEFARNAVLRELPGEFETIAEIADAVAEQEIYNLDENAVRDYPGKIRAVTLDQVNAAAREFLHPDRVAVVVVGDLGRIEEPVRALNLGPVRTLSPADIGLPPAE